MLLYARIASVKGAGSGFMGVSGPVWEEKRAGRRPAEVAGETRRAIVEAALGVFAEVGFDGASLREIAERAGTTHGLIRHYFGSKEGVWRAVVEAANAEYSHALEPSLAQTVGRDAPAETLKEALREIILVSARHPETVRLLMHEGTRGGARLDHILEQIASQRALIEPLFEEVRRRGYLRQFDGEQFFLFMLTAGAVPFALAPLTGRLTGADPLSEDGARRHADWVVSTLFGGGATEQ